jgi:hypothetical protein
MKNPGTDLQPKNLENEQVSHTVTRWRHSKKEKGVNP